LGKEDVSRGLKPILRRVWDAKAKALAYLRCKSKGLGCRSKGFRCRGKRFSGARAKAKIIATQNGNSHANSK
jgi:hypothetical protein